MSTIHGTNDSDAIYGTPSDDVIVAGEGDDFLDGLGGNDILTGGSGDDTLIDGEGFDYLQGGDGDDTYVISSRRFSITDHSGYETAIIKSDFVKVPSSIEEVVYEDEVLPLPYWLDALIVNDTSGYAFTNQILNYGFPAQIPEYTRTTMTVDEWEPFTPTQEAYTRGVLSYIGSIIGLTPREVNEFDQMDTIAFANEHKEGMAAHAYYPGLGIGSNFIGSDVYMGFLLPSTQGEVVEFEDGTFSAKTLIHEIGHALGLKHPTDIVSEPPFLSEVESSTVWSIMGHGRGVSNWPDYNYALFRPLDIAALQYLYGPSNTSRTGDDTYVFEPGAANFIWDGGGVDTISMDSASQGVTVYLSPGYWGYMGASPAEEITDVGQITINFGSVIENLIGSGLSDSLHGNEFDNHIDGRAGSDQIYGGDGNDRIVGGTGDDELDGGSGDDILIADWEQGSTGDNLTGGNGSDTFYFREGDIPWEQTSIQSLNQITDYNHVEGDRLDLSSFLGNHYDTGIPSPIGRIVRLVQISSDEGALLQVDLGSVGPSSWTSLAVVLGLGPGDVAGVVLDSGGTDSHTSDGIVAVARDGVAYEDNRNPHADDDSFSVAQEETLRVAVADLLDGDTDPDGDVLMVTDVSGAVNGQVTLDDQGDVDLGNDEVVFTPDSGFDGMAAFRYIITDGFGGTASALVDVAVTKAQNIAPMASTVDAGSVDEGDNVVSLDLLDDANATDSDGGTLDVAEVTVEDSSGNPVIFGLTGSLLTIDPKQFAEVLNDGDSLALSIAYTIIDGQGGSTPNSGILRVDGSGDDIFRGSDGVDTISAQEAGARIDGGEGIDAVVFSSARASASISREGSEITVSAPTYGSKTLINVERLHFSDGGIAFDIDGNAGSVAGILGVVFGPEAVQNTEYAGIGLDFLDSGISEEQLMQMALDVALSDPGDRSALVDLLYSNAVGAPPPQQDLDYFVGLIENDTYTEAGLAMMAADHSLNKSNINLIGLTETGLDYVF